MRRLMAQAAGAAIVAGLIVAPRLRGTTWTSWFTKLAWSWSGVPSGPLGWISSNWTMPVFHGPIYPVMARELDLQPDDDLLEVACGSGVFLATQATPVRHVAGLDLSDIQVGLARRRLADRILAGTAEIVTGDAASLPWDDGRFSVVTCMGSVEEAGFDEVSVSYAAIGFDSHVGNLANRLMGQDELRIVRGVKPAGEAAAQWTEEASRATVGATG